MTDHPHHYRPGRRMKPSERLQIGMRVRALLGQGRTYQQIADELGISIHLAKRWPTRRRA